jgi:hypothetical protein
MFNILGAAKEKDEQTVQRNRDSWSNLLCCLQKFSLYPYSSLANIVVETGSNIELSGGAKQEVLKFKVEEQLGRGKFAAVFRASSRRGGVTTTVALKVAQFVVDANLNAADIVPPEAVSLEFMV